jgi:hypothetical protein
MTTLAALIAMSTLAFAGPRVATAGVKPQPTPNPALNAPTLSCGTHTPVSITITVTAGNSGAPAGFSVQWMTLADFQANGGVWPTNEALFCKASFSGVPRCSNYNLGPNTSVDVQLGDNLFDDCGASSENCAGIPLQCDTQYVFRTFAHNVPQGANRSPYSSIISCSTAPCGGGCGAGCTFTQGYWKTHGPDACRTGNNANEWPASVQANGLTLGTVSYTADELCSVFNTPAGGNGLLTLAHQLIAAKINIANGADPSAIQSAIDSADALIGALVVPPVGSGLLAPGVTATLTGELTDYNEGTTGPGHCQ